MNTIVRNRRRSIACALLFGIAAALPIASQAAEPARSLHLSSSVVVNYADLDLADPAGAQALYARLKQATKKVCGYHPPPVDLQSSTAYRECFNATLSKAVNRVDSKQLYALHAQHEREAAVG